MYEFKINKKHKILKDNYFKTQDINIKFSHIFHSSVLR